MMSVYSQPASKGAIAKSRGCINSNEPDNSREEEKTGSFDFLSPSGLTGKIWLLMQPPL
jgi:hypothetical protein